MIDLVDNTYVSNCAYYDTRHFDNCFKDSSGMFILHLNINSFNANGDQMLAYLSRLSKKPQVLVISETRFSEEFHSNIEGYVAYHTFRPGIGGGISVFVDNGIKSEHLPELSIWNPCAEFCCVNVSPSSDIIITVLGVYRPPHSNLNDFYTTFHNVFSSYFDASMNVILVGDFNVDTLSNTSSCVDYITNFMTKGYNALINKPTRVTLDDVSSTCIDHLWAKLQFRTTSGIFETHISDHYPIFTIVDCQQQRIIRHIYFRDHSENNLLKLFDECDLVSNEVFNSENTNVNFLCDLLEEKLFKTYDSCCPIKCKNMPLKKINKPWLTDAIMLIINRKHALFRKLKRNEVSLEFYKQYCNMTKRQIELSKREYYLSKFEMHKHDTTATWKFLNSICRNSSRKDNFTKIDTSNGIISDSKAIANYFNDYFISVGRDLTQSIPDLNESPLQFMGERSPVSMFVTPCSSFDVEKVILSMANKRCGLDNIPIKIYKFFVEKLSGVIAYVFNLSIEQGIFPDRFKRAKVTPIHKSGSPFSVKNYRPISILPVLSKVFEKLMYIKLYTYLERMAFLSDSQYGFRKGLDTTDALLNFMHECHQSLHRGSHLIAVFLDLSKAFDTVSMNILLNKMEHIGIRGIINSWFKSYLSFRTQSVCINNEMSVPGCLTIGVPQGSILGPLLFLIYINDMKRCCELLNCVQYADDTTLYISGSNLNLICNTMNAQLEEIDLFI